MPTRLPRPRRLAPAKARELDIRIGASTRLPDGYTRGTRRVSAQTLMLRRWNPIRAQGERRDDVWWLCAAARLWRMVAAALRQTICPAVGSRRPDREHARCSGVAGRRDAPICGSVPHRRALVTLLRRLEHAGVLARLLRRNTPVPHLLLYQARGVRYPELFLVDVLMPRARATADRCAVLKAVRVPECRPASSACGTAAFETKAG